MRKYEEIVNAAEIAIQENEGRINCFEIENFTKFTEALEKEGFKWEMDDSTDWIVVSREKAVLQMKYEENGEWFEIWETEKRDIEAAWDEMDEQPTEGGRIRFEDSEEFMVVNGGF